MHNIPAMKIWLLRNSYTCRVQEIAGQQLQMRNLKPQIERLLRGEHSEAAEHVLIPLVAILVFSDLQIRSPTTTLYFCTTRALNIWYRQKFPEFNSAQFEYKQAMVLRYRNLRFRPGGTVAATPNLRFGADSPSPKT